MCLLFINLQIHNRCVSLFLFDLKYITNTLETSERTWRISFKRVQWKFSDKNVKQNNEKNHRKRNKFAAQIQMKWVLFFILIKKMECCAKCRVFCIELVNGRHKSIVESWKLELVNCASNFVVVYYVLRVDVVGAQCTPSTLQFRFNNICIGCTLDAAIVKSNESNFATK